MCPSLPPDDTPSLGDRSPCCIDLGMGTLERHHGWAARSEHRERGVWPRITRLPDTLLSTDLPVLDEKLEGKMFRAHLGKGMPGPSSSKLGYY